MVTHFTTPLLSQRLEMRKQSKAGLNGLLLNATSSVAKANGVTRLLVLRLLLSGCPPFNGLLLNATSSVPKANGVTRLSEK